MDKSSIQSPSVDYDLDFIKLLAQSLSHQDLIKQSLDAIKKAESMFGDDRSYNFYYYPFTFIDNKIYSSGKMYNKRDLKNIRDYALTHFPNNLPSHLPDIDKNFIILIQNGSFFTQLFNDLQTYIESRKHGKIYTASIHYPSFFSHNLSIISMPGDKLLYIYKNSRQILEL